MARIRTIKPEFWSDEKLSVLSVIDRLVFIGLISHADDAGRLLDNVKSLDGLIFPGTDDTCRDSLETLARLSRIIRYSSASGQKLIQITNWARHQKISNESKRFLPGPDAELQKQAENNEVARVSRESLESLQRPSDSDLGSWTLDRGPRTVDVSCPEASETPSRPEAKPDPVVLEFPVVGQDGQPWNLTESKISEYCETYPDLDVQGEVRKARQWCVDNRANRKTASGMPKFLNSWLARAQNDRGGNHGNGKRSGTTPAGAGQIFRPGDKAAGGIATDF